jgi:ribosomal protein L22
MTTAELERPQVRAVAKWVRISPRKARLVIDHIRGRTVPEARTVLAFTPRAAAREIEKVLRSAVANAEANHELIGDDLYVAEAHVDDGLIIKRWKPQARGRVARIKKRTCHITIKLSPVDGAAAVTRAPAPEPEAEEAAVVEEASTTESVGALTPEEQKAAAKPRRTRKAEPETEKSEAVGSQLDAEVAEPEAVPELGAASEPEAEEKNETPKRRAPRVRRKKKEEETES